MLFGLKKLLGGLLMPLPMVIIGLLLGCFLLFRRRTSAGCWVLSASIGVLYFCSIPIVSNSLARPLEDAFPKYAGQAVESVVVLGGYHRSDERRPVSALLSSTSMVRLSEGIRLHNLNPGSTLNLSGYGGNDPISNAEAMARVAQAYGVLSDSINIEETPKDTAEEARVWAQQLKGKQVVLVTSATHMPRAMYLFEQAGMRPLPAPTNFRSSEPELTYWRNWLPSASALDLTRAAWHEYLGLGWARLRAF